MKKRILLLCMLAYQASFSQSIDKNHANLEKYSQDKYSNYHNTEKTVVKKVGSVKPMNTVECLEQGYLVLEEFENIMKIEKNNEETVFNQLKNSEIWKSLNNENKKKMAEIAIKYNRSSDIKEADKIKKTVAKYYLEKCEDKNSK